MADDDKKLNGNEGDEGKENNPNPEPNPDEGKGDEGLKDKHGQDAIAKGKYERDIAERDKKIKELEAKVDEAAKTEQGRADLKAEFEKFKADTAKREMQYKLQAAGCVDAELAADIIGEMTIDELKEKKPYLFSTDEEKKGSTGFKPGGRADSKEERQRKADEALGYKAPKK